MVDYLRLKTLDDVLEMLWAEGPQLVLLAGGTDLLVKKKDWSQTKLILDIKRLEELKGIGYDEQGRIRVGAVETHQDISDHPLILKRARLLSLACGAVGSFQIRNLGTIGGNLANASPAADTVPALFCLGAWVVLVGKASRREIPVEEFFIGPGKTVLESGELIESVRFQPTSGRMAVFFKKAGQRRGMCCSKASVAFSARRHSDGRLTGVRIALGAVAPTVVMAREAAAELENRVLEPELIERAAQLCSQAARPINDIRSTAEYRRQVVGALLKIGLLELLDHIRRMQKRAAELRRRRRWVTGR